MTEAERMMNELESSVQRCYNHLVEAKQALRKAQQNCLNAEMLAPKLNQRTGIQKSKLDNVTQMVEELVDSYWG